MVIESEAQRDRAPAVVPGECEPAVPQRTHHRHRVVRDGALGVPGVVGRGCRTARTTVPPQVGADDREAALDESGRDAMPGRGSPRMTVLQQQHRRAPPAIADENGCLSDVNRIGFEVLEHRPNISHEQCLPSAFGRSAASGAV